MDQNRAESSPVDVPGPPPRATGLAKSAAALRSWARRRLASAGYVYFKVGSPEYYAQDSLFTTNNDDFRRSPRFRAAYARGLRASCGVDPHIEWRVHVALWAAGVGVRAAGDFVECGVNAGFLSSAIMQYLDWAALPKRFHLIDTFQGPVLSQYTAEEISSGRAAMVKDAVDRGAYVTDLERVAANFSEWPNVALLPGVVPDVLRSLHIGRVAFLHLDMNCAYPERAALEFFWDSLSPGGVVLLDDYGYFGYDSHRQAIDAVVQQRGADVLSLPTGQGLIMR